MTSLSASKDLLVKCISNHITFYVHIGKLQLLAGLYTHLRVVYIMKI